MTSRLEIENQIFDGNLSPIKKFYANANIFLTGGTGFIGILLLEKLLASCPNLSKIYMLVRAKKGKTVETRLEQLFDDVVFSRLKKQYPNFRDKIVPVEGDCELPDLGLSNQDRELLITEVNIIFHGAATVRFDETLKKAARINVKAVRDITRLAQQMPNLKSFVHISTAYCNCIHSHIKEEVYPPAYDYKKLLVVTEALSDDVVTKITPMLLDKYPNTYTFTKQIGENVIIQEGAGLPIGIHRPSIVQSTFKEPSPGWTNNFYGPNGFVAGAGLGILHILLIRPGAKSNMVPADLVVNSIIATAWDVAENFVENGHIPVYNFESSQSHILTWENYIRACQSFAASYCPVRTIWCPFYIQTQSRIYYIVGQFLLHKVPAFLVDSVGSLLGKPPVLMKLYKKVDKLFDVVSYFLHREWSFDSKNMSKLKSKMSEEDTRTFFCEMKNFNWKEYFEPYVSGIRIYLIKDPLETIPAGRKKHTRLLWIHRLTVTVIVIFTLLLWWLFFNFVFKFVV